MCEIKNSRKINKNTRGISSTITELLESSRDLSFYCGFIREIF